MSEPEVTPPISVPKDWRDWVNEFPSIKSVALTCVIAWLITPIVMTVAGWLIGSAFISGPPAIDGVLRMISIWLDALNWLTLAAVFGVVTKRATEKPEVIKAEGEVKAAAIVATAQADAVKASGTWPVPQPVGAPHPNTDPAIVSALESVAAQQRSDEAILAQEAEARKQKHALAPPVDGED